MSVLEKKCVICGKNFTLKNDKGMYCGDSCRVKAFRRRKKKALEAENANPDFIPEAVAQKFQQVEAAFGQIVQQIGSLAQLYVQVNPELVNARHERTSGKIENLEIELSRQKNYIDILENRIKELSVQVWEMKSELKYLDKTKDSEKSEQKSESKFGDAVSGFLQNEKIQDGIFKMSERFFKTDSTKTQDK